MLSINLLVRLKMSKTTQLLIFFPLLIAALFLPSSCQPQSQLDHDVVTDDNCYLKTSVILNKLDAREKEKCQDESNRLRQLWTDEVKETIGAARKHQDESKSQFDQLSSSLEKVQEAIGSMMKHQDENKSQLDHLTNKLEKVDETLSNMERQSQLVTECKRWLQMPNLSRTGFFIAEGQYLYFHISTILNWNETREWCVDRKMQMPMLKTQSHMDAVVKALKKSEGGSYNSYWMDASDVGQTAGEFRWADGTLVDGTTWQEGKISKTYGDWNETTCVNFSADNAWLLDENCSTLFSILCQVPAALTACL